MIHERAYHTPVYVLILAHVVLVVPRHPPLEELDMSVTHSVQYHVSCGVCYGSPGKRRKDKNQWYVKCDAQ